MKKRGDDRIKQKGMYGGHVEVAGFFFIHILDMDRPGGGARYVVK